MDDVDDDFGDLYADVEVEATSAINTAPPFSKTQCVTDEIDRACVSVNNDEDEDDDDEDDDLDIVLNSDDDSIKRSDGYTILSVRNRELQDEDDDNVGSEYLRSQSVAYGSDLKGIGCLSAAYWQQLGSRSMGAQTAQRFSLPRARNILDVNIDVFEQKPWRHPGADITDYFNFGFNEDSWKVYCNQVDEYRHRGFVSSGTTPSEPAQSTEVYTNKGQAIQVEDSIFERQSSMDVRRQLDRDSDAIQITILDPADTSVPEASDHGDGCGDDMTDHLSFSSASIDESVEEKDVETYIHPPKMRSGSEIYAIHQVVTDETVGTSNDTKESNLVEKSFEAEKIPANRSYSYEDDAYMDTRKAYTHDRCLTRLTRSMKSDYHHSEDSGKLDDNRRPDENRYRARKLGDDRKNRNRIYHKRSNSPVYNNHENDYIISKRTYDKRKSDEYRYHARHNNGIFPVFDEVHSTFRQRLHAFDPYNAEDISYSKSEVPSDYYGEKFCGYEDWDTEKFGANMDRSISRSLEEDEYYDERRRYIEDRGEMEESYLDPGHYNDTHIEKLRSFTNSDRKRYDIEYTRWEFRGPGRNKRTVCGVYSELDNPLLKRDNERSFASRSSEESHIKSCRWDGNMMPKRSVYRRRESYRGQYSEPFDREDYMIDVDGGVECEDEIMFRHEDAKFCAHRNSFLFGKVSRRKRFVSEPDPYPDHVEELIDDPYDGSGYVKELTAGQHANRCRYFKQKNEVFGASKSSKAYRKSRERLPLSFRNPQLVVGEVKFSKKHKKPKWMDLDTCLNDKAARADETKAADEALDIEEGQILTEEVKVGPMMDKTRSYANGSRNQNGKSGFDSTRILEAMAKMEKRRARFNAPVAVARKDSYSSIKVAAVDPIQETGSNKQQRPARKRRWGASEK
ncbi:putative pre-mRNA polyadenylation factor Fip1 domain-containing protein [Helianthus annuus]|uniref:Pre-mRNA polyadenylation factor Fip1 domain-containing protein n=1 Tax=Helianthus annuus TaxID=4232 RepID=A0A251UQJ1_HELAN|nr:FIP1[V]-like protein isoform X1 [Helianthus annuus]KAF5806148.1 putative pre-mRNA polyadenylation factor Fip1 domain-containing protein [Helianthus annuus]KAJ0584795.1 putative pre-mRNA polyadenylation factor Fip1 domain-containing protein [Helianthus annuus]KAJ0750455.1 putative pre-mRNA polyadenylation factor Fip1 domain-containing protein [Helianthus annuus]